MKTYIPLRPALPTLSGWTLTEVLVAMAIVFLLSGTVGFVGSEQITRARHLSAQQQMSVFRLALESYAIDTGAYPTTEQGLSALREAPVLDPVPDGWRGPYIVSEIPTDPWGAEYEYRGPREDGTFFTLSYSKERPR
ncbi:MAG: type II secretion system major pseudopilin GspG [Alkalispirochaeta sp.]